MNELISGFVGLILGIIFEEPLTNLRDNILHKGKQLIYKTKKKKEYTGLFSFGSIDSTWMIVDGDGESEYSPKTLTTHFDTKPLVLPADLQKKVKEIEREQQERKKKGETYHFNGEHYRLDKFSINRSTTDEDLELELWFGPTDYYTFQATNMSLDDNDLYDKYLSQTTWNSPVKYFSNTFGINLCVITEDDHLILTKRSQLVGTNKGLYHISVNEGLSRTFDRGLTSQAPDIYRASIRGIIEELGVNDTKTSDITLLSLGVDTKYSQWGMLGKAHIDKTSREILEWRARGVKDKWESEEFVAIPFRVKEVVDFVFEHPHWTPAGITCIYHTLVNEFTREKVDKEILKHSKR